MIGARLKQLRNKKNLTLNQLAKYIGTTSMTLSRYENNQRQPDNETLKKIADYFEVSIDYLLDRTDIPNFIQCESSVVKIPVYIFFGPNANDIAPVSTMDIATSSYDFVLDFDKVIGVDIVDDRYAPHFLAGDKLLVELTDEVNTWSPYYLVNLNPKGNEFGKEYEILELIGSSKQYIFTGINHRSRVIFNPNKFTIIGRLISLIRDL